MIRIFKIIEKIVIAITVLAIVIVLVLAIIGLSTNTHVTWSKFIPYLYLAATLFVAYKIVVIFSSFVYKNQIIKTQEFMDSMGDLQKRDNAILRQEKDQSQKLDTIIEAVKQVPQANTDAIVDILQERLPEIVQKLVSRQVEEEKRRLAEENEKRLNEINVLSADVSNVLERRDYLLKLEKEIKLRQEEDRKRRLEYTGEYTMLVFSLAGTSVEDVEKVCDVVKSFIQTGQMSADKDLQIPLNKKLRNAELKQFVSNIIRYNQKENLDGDSFLQTAFGEWFSGKKENIAKNYSMLPKDSLVSKDGLEADLINLRKRLYK